MAEANTPEEQVKLNRQLAQMLKGGVIMDVTTPEQARIAEEAGACAVMALKIQGICDSLESMRRIMLSFRIFPWMKTVSIWRLLPSRVPMSCT